MGKARPTQLARYLLAAPSDPESYVTQAGRIVLAASITRSPTVPTGAGVTQLGRVLLVAEDDVPIRVTQLGRIVLTADTTPDPVCPPSGGGQHGYVSIG